MKENGVIRRRLSGKEADPYIGLGRKILGEMKNIMQMGGLQQLSWTKDFQNGVRIMVSSIFGQDEIRILVPVLPRQLMPEELSRSEEVELSTEFICGGIYLGAFPTACYWKDSIIHYLTPAGSFSYAMGISVDGTVCGGTAYFSGIYKAAMWVNGDIRLLGFDGIVQAVSEDGKVLAGQAKDANGNVFVWTEEGGYRLLGRLGTSFESSVSKISSDGLTIVGSANGIGATWDVATGAVTKQGTNTFMLGISKDGGVLCGGQTLDVYEQPVIVIDGSVTNLNFGAGQGYCTSISDNGNVVAAKLGGYDNPPETAGIMIRNTGEVRYIQGASIVPKFSRFTDLYVSQNGEALAGTLIYKDAQDNSVQMSFRANVASMDIQVLSSTRSQVYDIKINKKTIAI